MRQVLVAGACVALGPAATAAEGAAASAGVPAEPAGGRPPCAAAASPRIAPPTGAVSLAAAVAAALAASPALAAARWEACARDARVVQAGLLPNPELRGDVENVAGSGARAGVESSETTIRLAQRLELGGARGRRRSLAAAERALADFDYEARRLALVAEVTKAFTVVLAAQERVAIEDEVEAVAAESVTAVEARIAAGAAAPVEGARARMALERARVERARARRMLAAARGALAATWGDPRARFARADGELAARPRLPSRAAVLARAEGNPDVARWAVEIEARAAALALAESEAVPSVTLEAGARHFGDGGDHALVFDLSLPLPVFDRNQGAIAAARAALGQARAERRAAEIDVRAALAAAYDRMASAREEAERLRETVLPQARSLLDATRAAHRQGLLGSLDVLDAQRTLFEVRAAHLQALEAWQTAAADVERLAAAPLDAMADGGER